MAKPFSKWVYASAQWEKVRKLVLIRDYHLCVHCGEAAWGVHHIIELNADNINDMDIVFGMDNLESICKTCHDESEDHSFVFKKNNATSSGFTFDDNGDIIEVYKQEDLREEK
jgi:thymidine kinase